MDYAQFPYDKLVDLLAQYTEKVTDGLNRNELSVEYYMYKQAADELAEEIRRRNQVGETTAFAANGYSKPAQSADNVTPEPAWQSP